MSSVKRQPPVTEPGYTEVADSPTSQAEVAVLVCHGMGQQVHFETLEDVAKALRTKRGVGVEGKSLSVAQRQVGDTRIPRVDLRLSYTPGPGEPAREQNVHLYEAWWAPLTEGQITRSEVIAFLFGAAWDGIRTYWVDRNASPPGFQRHLFGEFREFPGGGLRTTIRLVAVLAVLIALIVLNTMVTLIAGGSAIAPTGSTWPSPQMVSAITWDVLLFGLAAGALAGIGIRARRQPPVFVALGLIVLLAFVVTIRLSIGPEMPVDWNGWLGKLPRWVVVFPWLLLLWVGRYAQGVFVEYIGDVAIYVQSHRVNRFHKTRQEIRESVLDVARMVYAGGYKRVVIVGHSLGSVIAYDTLNALVNECELRPNPPVNVNDVTQALVTFGSPLDKTAFLFRTQVGRNAEIRERLAALVQPLIQDYRYRPPLWVNIYSKADWISGDLEFYDCPGERAVDRRVRNLKDPEANQPGLAHIQYWKNSRLAEVLQLAVVDPAALMQYVEMHEDRREQGK